LEKGKLKPGNEEEIHFKGAPVSEGIAIGFPVFLSVSEEEEIPEFPITTGEVEDEIKRYRRALSSSREDLRKLQLHLAEEGSSDVVSIIDAHLQMLDDPLMTTHMEKKIREMLQNTESVFQTVLTDYEKRFLQTPDAFFRQRLVDVKDLSKRVLRNLAPESKVSLNNIPPNSIVFARELVPSDTASIQATRVSAFVTQKGSGTSHAALIARSKGIPYVASIDVEAMENARGKCVIVDGLTGDIIINPSSDTLEKYEMLKTRLTSQYQQLEKDQNLPCETTDGFPVDIFANINTINDVELAHHHNAVAIGLFRSEYLFLQEKEILYSEELQYQLYLKLVQKAEHLSVTIRVMDMGGDKSPDFFPNLPKEPNPVLGCRGIRFLIRYKDIFRIQLRAILRASVSGNIKILLPLVSDIHELREVKNIIREMEAELRSEGIPYREKIPLGCMLEVPSAILICDSIAQECDFLAIGTNDLVQYTLGIDRNNPGMSDYYYPNHPSVIRMIKMTILEAKKYQRPVTICGEIASNPLFTSLLVGLGVQKFSCAPRFIPIIKRTIRQFSLVEACQIADHVLSLKTSAEITEYLLKKLQYTEQSQAEI
jgi:phosphotransferase system enzyme I (PtsI)